MEQRVHQAGPEGAPAAASAPKKIRRVGTVACGLVLVIAGSLLLVRMLVPGFDLTTVLKFSPVVLIVLGIEVLIYSARPDVALRYDFLSILACVFILALVGATCIVPELWRYYGPEQDQRRARVERYLTDTLLEALDAAPGMGDLVHNVSFRIYGEELLADLDGSDAELAAASEVYASISLNGQYDNPTDFAADCRKIVSLCEEKGLVIQELDFLTEYPEEALEATTYSLGVTRWMWGNDAQTLASYVRTSYWYDGASYSSEENRDDFKRGHEEENQAQYEEGWQDGYEAALAELEGQTGQGPAQDDPDAPQTQPDGDASLDETADEG